MLYDLDSILLTLFQVGLDVDKKNKMFGAYDTANSLPSSVISSDREVLHKRLFKVAAKGDLQELDNLHVHSCSTILKKIFFPIYWSATLLCMTSLGVLIKWMKLLGLCRVIYHSRNALLFKLEEFSFKSLGLKCSKCLVCDPFAALHAELENFNTLKVFICLSTVMTWARSKPLDPVSFNHYRALILLQSI